VKYVPLEGPFSKNRKYIGKHWNKKFLRGIQCILLATHGVVGPKRAFFEKAFGRDVQEFCRIILMPEDYIIHRKQHESDGSTRRWCNAFDDLTPTKCKEATALIEKSSTVELTRFEATGSLGKLLVAYK
jgi:hypothetical protein